MDDKEKKESIQEKLEATIQLDKVVEKANEAKEEMKEDMKGLKNAFQKVGEKAKDLKEKITGEDKKEAYVTCRVLFISVLDKLMLLVLAILFIGLTCDNFAGNIASLGYGFWYRVLEEFGIIIGIVIAYFFYNWIYRCAAKTMMCVTDGQIYYEKYVPFYRWEGTIPLDKVTNIISFKFFWIFRAVIIFQYMHLPKVFWTWNAQEFKDKVEELMTKSKTKVKNQYESRNIINKPQYKYLILAGVILFVVIFFLGIVRFFAFVFTNERNVYGVYQNGSEVFTLKKDGTCTIDLNNVKSVKCNWEYNPETTQVTFKYSYESRFYGSSSESQAYMYATYDKNTLIYNNREFKK